MYKEEATLVNQNTSGFVCLPHCLCRAYNFCMRLYYSMNSLMHIMGIQNVNLYIATLSLTKLAYHSLVIKVNRLYYSRLSYHMMMHSTCGYAAL